jgi:hypothetical protein
MSVNDYVPKRSWTWPIQGNRVGPGRPLGLHLAFRRAMALKNEYIERPANVIAAAMSVKECIISNEDKRYVTGAARYQVKNKQ